MSNEPVSIWTIGHSTRTIIEFIDLLKVHDIGMVADVRRFPGSRRHPQFGREQLASSLEQQEISYLHFAELGGRRPVHPDSPNTAWRNASFRGYAVYDDGIIPTGGRAAAGGSPHQTHGNDVRRSTLVAVPSCVDRRLLQSRGP